MSRAWFFAVLVAVVTVPTTASAQPRKDKAKAEKSDDAKAAADSGDDALYTCRKARGRFKVNLKDEVELKDLITWAMSFRCENFVYGSGVGGRSAKVVLVTPKEMSAGQAWKVWQVALQNMNLAWVKKGNVIEIIEGPQAKRQALPIYRGTPPNSDRVVRALIRPTHLPINELAAVLAELKSKDGEVKTLTNAGLLVVTDFGTHIAKMRQVVRAIDQQVSGEQLYMIRVKYADATELATKLGELLGTKEAPGAASSAPSSSSRSSRRRNRRGRDNNRSTSTGPTATKAESNNVVPTKIIAEERTNSLIVLSSEAAYRRVRSLVKRLDLPIDVEGGGRIHVYVLQHADAEELSTTLTTLITGAQPQRTGNQRNQNPRARTPARPTSSATPGADAFEGQVRVTHDAPTNSLVIVASVKDFLALRQVVRRLDTPRSQVYIEATIVEVNVDNTRDVGVSYHAGAPVGENGGLGFGGFQTPNLSTVAVAANPASLATISGAFGGVLGPLIDEASELLGLSIPSYGVLFQALATNSNVNVLSTPHIMTTDNQEAEISVGTNVPYQAAQIGGAVAGQIPGFGNQSIQRKDIALTLKITPQINASANIRLDIDLQIEDIASPDFNGFGPSWSTRSIKDTVVVRDQETVVIGGLMQDRTQNNESKVPLLGDIPVLGYLFKYQTKSKVKTNLLVMLTPYVIREQSDLARIKEKRVREQREFVRTFTSFDQMKDKEDVDYRRKRGLLDQINQTITNVDREIEIRRELESRSVGAPDGLIELDEEPDEGDEEGDAAAADDAGKTEGKTEGEK
ncbi:MAG: type II secretion system secretin GspD [Deltaproteobacteria bacterium]|nr:type II secretion system secretin GspD [Deltaproteobacteria bacterium]